MSHQEIKIKGFKRSNNAIRGMSVFLPASSAPMEGRVVAGAEIKDYDTSSITAASESMETIAVVPEIASSSAFSPIIFAI